MIKKTSIGFIGNFEYNCGSSNTILGYVQAAKRLNYDVRISEFGYVDNIIRKYIPNAKKDWIPDLMVIVYETYPFLSKKNIDNICNTIPRKKLVILDPDGKYSVPQKCKGDKNHENFESYLKWKRLYESLSDVILQPTFNISKGSKIKSFLYFGANIHIKNNINLSMKKYDILYVGNNWYRWDDMKKFVSSISSVRELFRNFTIIGNYWDLNSMKKYKKATLSDPNFLKTNNITLRKPVSFGKVETTMSMGMFNLLFIRPILNHLKFFTPRMFETIVADTLPILPNYFLHAEEIYGSNGKYFTLSENPIEDLIKLKANYGYYQNLKKSIEKLIVNKHSYENRLLELSKFIN